MKFTFSVSTHLMFVFMKFVYLDFAYSVSPVQQQQRVGHAF